LYFKPGADILDMQSSHSQLNSLDIIHIAALSSTPVLQLAQTGTNGPILRVAESLFRAL
jgi:hypothetical protein